MAALEGSTQYQRPSQRHSQTKTHAEVSGRSAAPPKGLGGKDVAISERLQKLKDATRPGLKTLALLF